jgi:probable F420-dependent oxidoreductase
MKVGAIFPQTECGTDVGAIGEFVRTVEAMGFDHLFVADHVLGADPRFHSHPSLVAYSHETVVHEALTLMAYLAAVTTRLTLATGILILPQRQTVLVAKQAAQIDVLSGGRLRLGIGVGWNAVEYEALNEAFENRGRRSAEQVTVLRALWTQEVVDFQGEFHRIRHAGLNPRPIQRPIPVWFGVGGRERSVPPDAALRRIARLADGWSPNLTPDAQGLALVARVHQYRARGGPRADHAPAGGPHPSRRPRPRRMDEAGGRVEGPRRDLRHRRAEGRRPQLPRWTPRRAAEIQNDGQLRPEPEGSIPPARHSYMNVAFPLT